MQRNIRGFLTNARVVDEVSGNHRVMTRAQYAEYQRRINEHRAAESASASSAIIEEEDDEVRELVDLSNEPEVIEIIDDEIGEVIPRDILDAYEWERREEEYMDMLRPISPNAVQAAHPLQHLWRWYGEFALPDDIPHEGGLICAWEFRSAVSGRLLVQVYYWGLPTGGGFFTTEVAGFADLDAGDLWEQNGVLRAVEHVTSNQRNWTTLYRWQMLFDHSQGDYWHINEDKTLMTRGDRP